MGSMALLVVLAALVAFPSSVAAEARRCDYALISSTDGVATVSIHRVAHGPWKNVVRIAVEDAPPQTLYTVWVDFRDQPGGGLPQTHPAGARAVAPAFALRAGVTSGITPDPNAFITDQRGRARWQGFLDYDLLEPGDSPVVVADLAMQGLNEVAGAWMRMYDVDPSTAASVQLVDAEGLPIVERGTARGFTIVRHPDFVTHGHTPGVGGVDHFGAFKGNFPCP